LELGQRKSWKSAKGVFMSKFLRVKCKCGNEQNIFGNASSKVACLVCSEVIARPSGSRVEVAEGCKIIKVL